MQCYTSETRLAEFAEVLRDLLRKMGRRTRQGAVGLLIDRDYLELSIPATKG